ncbi:MGH1-like glycoside hydrolase domain-containing protein [Ktedonobacter robiniae]|uniref:Glycoside hydrolase n=1 Tax=Ktedonobacter robiniae TaxID=2778365 RepID=A0ABQ3V1U6_9CHLR|nr:trehalase family glycosidase [Ktedonobacter robiniae]GHO58557.1 glycoside hydrolase [Ktedonobacter robiniae]
MQSHTRHPFLARLCLLMLLLYLLPLSPALSRSTRLADGGNPYHYTLEQLQAALPQPILDNHPQWITMYWGAWQILTKHILAGTPENGFVSYYMDPAFNGDIFLWDTVFMSMFARYGRDLFPVTASFDNFYRKQDADGFIARQFKGTSGLPYQGKNDPNSINPPILSWGEWEYYQLSGDSSRLKTVLPRLIKFYTWVKTHRTNSDGLYWNTGVGSGMDNSPEHTVCDTCIEPGQDWIDMSAQQALNALSISRIAQAVGNTQLASQFQQEYAHLKNLINQRMWSKQDGMYYPIKDGQQRLVKTIGSFWPLLAQLADTNQVSRLIKEHLLNPNEFYREHPFASLAATDPHYNAATGNYWNGGVWAPTNYMVERGLKLYGEEDTAYQAALQDIDNVYRVYQRTGTLWENYAPDSASQGIPARPNFVGWSGNFAISELLEDIIGLRVDTPAHTLNWRLNLTERNGITNLHFGQNVVSLVAEQRQNASDTPHLTVQALQPFTLKLSLPGGKTFAQTFTSGKWRWTPDSKELKDS